MAGFSSGDIWWVALAGVVGSYAAWFGIKSRLGVSWLLRRARRGFVDWFGESIDKHVAPQFVELRDELHETAKATQENTRVVTETLRAEAVAAAETLRAEAVAAAETLRAEMATTAETMKVELDERSIAAAERVGELVHDEVAPIEAKVDVLREQVGVVEPIAETVARIEEKLDGTNGSSP